MSEIPTAREATQLSDGVMVPLLEPDPANQGNPQEAPQREVLIQPRRVTIPPTPRILVSEMVHHSQPGRSPIICESRYGRWLQTQEQPWVREYVGTLAATKEWRPLVTTGHCWLERVGMLHLRNAERPPSSGANRLPSKEEIEASAGQTIELAIEVYRQSSQSGKTMREGVKVEAVYEPIVYVPPGESCRYYPASLAKLFVRSRDGSASFVLTLFPE